MNDSPPPIWPDMTTRSRERECMDDAFCPEGELLRTVDQFDPINLYLSRFRAIVTRHVFPSMQQEPARVHTLVDLGAGGCDIPAWMLHEATRRRLSLRVQAWDSDARIVAHARGLHNNLLHLTVRQADALTTPVEQPVDYVFGNHFLHHLSDEEIVALLQRWAPLVNKRMIFNDLARSRWSYIAFYLLTLMVGRGTFHRQDGLLSIRRGFTIRELGHLAKRAGLSGRFTIESLFPGRLVLVVQSDRRASKTG